MEITVSYHAIERFQERILGIPPTNPKTFVPEDKRKYINDLIIEEIAECHPYIDSVGSGTCVSTSYCALFIVDNFSVTTVKKKEKKEYREMSGGILKKSCKRSKEFKKKLDKYKSK